MTSFKLYGDFEIVICEMPMRKKPCLAIKYGNSITKYATFNDEKSAEEFIFRVEEHMYKEI